MESIGLPMTTGALISFSFPWVANLQVGLPETAALAAVALIGYLFGQRTRQAELAEQNAERQQQLQRASGIAHQLEAIAGELRQDLASHHGHLTRFQRRLREARDSGNEKAWQLLCTEAELVLAPTMRLAQQLSLAYDAIRQQSDALETFSQARTDPLTGVGNGRALEEKFDVLLNAARRGGADFSIALVSIDRQSPGSLHSDEPKVRSQLQDLARLIRSCMRESDFVARYGDDEFVVVMPQTKLAGACVFGERLRVGVEQRMSATVSCGVAEYQTGDDEKTLLGRADSAFYSAKAAGGNRQFVHTGSQIREQRTVGPPRSADAPLPVAALPPIPPLHAAAESLVVAATPAMDE
jgi:diguanylate cyclase (GGDEF)-like protein